MDERRMVRVSKYLAKHLRHEPHTIGIELDPQGWVEIDVLLRAAKDHGFAVTRDELEAVVEANDKRRYVIEDERIRASQGHSVEVDLGLTPVTPPPFLYHGTIGGSLASIRASGLRPMKRQYVHLSADRDTALKVGARRGKPVVLSVEAGAMHGAGHEFRVSANGVWLVEHVPPGYLRFPSSPEG